MEQYDSLGRARAIENLFDHTGMFTGSLPLDLIVHSPSDSPQVLHGPLELSKALGSGDAAESCFVRQWIRFTGKRLEGDSDRCVIDAGGKAITGHLGSIRALLEGTVFDPGFRLRLREKSAPQTNRGIKCSKNPLSAEIFSA